MKATLDNSTVRAAFTLVEVLVVIGIILLLTTILVFAIGPTLENARINATKVTIAQLDDIIQQRLDAIKRLDLTAEAKAFSQRTSLTLQRAEFILRKNLYRQALPQSILDWHGLDGLTGGANSFDDAPLLSAIASPSDITNSQLFLLAITKGSQVRTNGAYTSMSLSVAASKSYSLPVLDIGSLNQRHVVGPDPVSGLYDVIDSWEQPLSFYNWPTRLIRTGGNNTSISVADRNNASILISSLPSITSALTATDYTNPTTRVLNTDPDDPTGLLVGGFSSSVNIDYNLDGSSDKTIPAFNETSFHTTATYFTPLLVSGGPDLTTGLTTPLTSGASRLAQPVSGQSDSLTDNITNRQQ